MLEDMFEGTVYLRDARGDLYPFIYRRYWNMLVTSTWSTPEVKIAPGAILEARGGGRFQFEMPEINTKIDFSIEKTENGRKGVYSAGRVPQEHLRQAGEECRKLLRERYPDLR